MPIGLKNFDKTDLIQDAVKAAQRCWPEAPFDKSGNQVSYPGWDSEMRNVERFEDALTFVGFERGRSAASAIFRRASSGTTVVMFLTDLSHAMPYMRDGRLEGLFHYVKRGQNYGVAYA